MSSRSLETTLKSILTLCLSSADKGVPINKSGLVDDVCQCINTIVNRFKSAQSDINVKRIAQDLVKIYFECLSDIADISLSLSTDEDTLIHSWIGLYLGICSINEISMIMNSINSLLTRVRMLLCSGQMSEVSTTEQLEETDRQRKLVSRLWTVVFPAVRQLAVSLTAPEAVGALAANFIIQKAENVNVSQSETASLEEIVKYMTQNKNVPTEISANVLLSISHNSAVMSHVSKATLMTSLALTSASAPVHTQDSLRETWSQLVADVQDEDTDVALMVILHNVSNPGIVSCMSSLCCDMTAWKGDEAVLRQYQVAGWLVYHCNNTLYNPSANFSNQLSNILNNLLTPNEAFSATWSFSLQKKKAIRQSLTFFIQGIVTHKSFTSDKFLARKLTEIIRIYLPRYDASNHPLLCLLKDQTFLQNSDLSYNIASLTLDVVAQLIRENVKTPRIAMVSLKYLDIAVENPPPYLPQLLISYILPSILHILLHCEERSVTNPAISITKYLLLQYDENMQISVAEKIRSFVGAHLAFNSERVYKSLKVISVLNKKVIADVLPYLLSEVEKIEKRRGSGKDTRLRSAFLDLQKLVIA